MEHNLIVICDKAKQFRCVDCGHASPHRITQIDKKPCTCSGWCIPPNEIVGVETKCIEFIENENKNG